MEQVVNASATILNTTVGAAAWTVKPLINLINSSTNNNNNGYQIQQEQIDRAIMRQTIQTLVPTMRSWIAVAGLMGASAVAIGAYGAHVVYPRKEIPDNRKAIFETANKYHFLHSLALIGVPFCRRPCVTGALFLTGTLVFSGTCYYTALTDNKAVTQWTPYGGMALIFAWLSMLLP